MRTSVASLAAESGNENEDWFSASAHLLVVLDGATARTGTGCIHGISWYSAHLGAALSEIAHDPSIPLRDVLAAGIQRVSNLHRSSCNLSHPGTPSAAVAIVRIAGARLDYLVLGDVTVVLDMGGRILALSDERVSQTAMNERRAADSYSIGTAEKDAAMVRMKHAELAQRNRENGYWIAAADPTAAQQSLAGHLKVGEVRRLAVLTDGAARIVKPFGLLSWPELLDLAEAVSPEQVLRQVREAEASDPLGSRWPRNKASDDATMLLGVGVGD
ncbi:protein phosphatase 2C domain-containing protein [Paractinoplanes brasiliensis]|uniref:Protein phosphatase 2C-like protein n=1 Tax=Paractinoplanes brasiliensis TaxID=52695 RepID=A0A4R6JUQ6_9ACTN|nr:protein phosphatase 2C domain-containing protein [Actinoplanes brasiliensis]TDO38385.1 protein phosphatase 2C-like protein [Actinoplanes brasiliensis]GID26839.1 hypothetical protein Abr02nite_18220 [Actinoplanes brasiliensis]